MITHIIRNKNKTFTLPRLAGKIKELVNSKNPEISHVGSNWNGFGYSDHEYFYNVSAADFEEIKNFVEKKTAAPKKEKKTLSAEESRAKWARRLAKLTGISQEAAEQIAAEKKEYKEKQIEMMNARQCENYSRKRQTLINKMERENPLRYIKDAEHAAAILAASNRHKNTNYEAMLDEARELAAWGDIDRAEVKEWARANCG